MTTRYLLLKADGSVESGADYPGCAPDNPVACQPAHHNSLTEAISYAQQRGETTVMVSSADEAFRQIAAGSSSGLFGLDLWQLGAIAGIGWLLLRRRANG